MSRRVYIDLKLEEDLNYYLQNKLYQDAIGASEEINFIKQANWVKDSAVIDKINYIKGIWRISLLFAHYKDPLQFIIRHITNCHSEQKATISAYLFRKNAAKDQRGTLEISPLNFTFCKN